MRRIIYLFIGILLVSSGLGAQCYEEFMRKGKIAYDDLDFEYALKQFKAAEVCCVRNRVVNCEAAAWIEKAENGYLDAIQQRTREILASDLANKSEQLLEHGDRTSSFRLAEYAYKLAPNSPKAQAALFGAVYCNDLQNNLNATYLWSKPFEGHSDRIHYAEYSPDGKKLVTACRDGTAKIWDVATQTVLATLLGHSDEVKMARFSADGELVATASLDGTSRIWDVESGNQVQSIALDMEFASASFSPDREAILTSDYSGNVVLWRKDGALKDIIVLEGNYIDKTYFSPDGKMIITPEKDGSIRFWSFENALFLRRIVVNPFAQDFRLSSYEGFFTTVDFCSARNEMLVSTLDNDLAVYDLTSGELKFGLETFDFEFGPGIYAKYVEQGSKILAVSGGKDFKLYDAENGDLLKEFGNSSNFINTLAVSPISNSFVTGQFDETLKLWDIGNTSEEKHPVLMKYKMIVECVSPKRTMIAFYESRPNENAYYKNVEVHNVVTEKGKDQLNFGKQGIPIWSGRVKDIEIRSEDKFLYVDASGIVNEVDVSNEKKTTSFPFNRLRFSHASSTKDGKKILGCTEKQAYIWNALSGNQIWSDTLLRDQKTVSNISDCEITGSGKYAAVAMGNGELVVIDVEKKQKTRQFAHRGMITQIAFTPNEQFLVTNSQDNTLKVWQLPEVKQVLNVERFSDYFQSFDISPDGKYVMGVGMDGNIQIWDLEEKIMKVNLDQPFGKLESAFFVDEALRIFTIDGNSYGDMWTITTRALLQSGSEEAGAMATQKLLENNIVDVLELDQDLFLDQEANSDNNWKIYARVAANRAAVAVGVEEARKWFKEVERARSQIKDSQFFSNLEQRIDELKLSIARRLFLQGEFAEAEQWARPLQRNGHLEVIDFYGALSQLVQGDTKAAMNALFPILILRPDLLVQELDYAYNNELFCFQAGNNSRNCIPFQRLAPLFSLKHLYYSNSAHLNTIENWPNTPKIKIPDASKAVKPYLDKANQALYNALENLGPVPDQAKREKGAETLGQLYKEYGRHSFLEIYLAVSAEVLASTFDDNVYDIDFVQPETLPKGDELVEKYTHFRSFYELLEHPLMASSDLDDWREDESFTIATLFYIFQLLKDNKFEAAQDAIGFIQSKTGLLDFEVFLPIEIMRGVTFALQGNIDQAKALFARWAWIEGDDSFGQVDKYLVFVEANGISHPLFEELRAAAADPESWVTYSDQIRNELYYSPYFYEEIASRLLDEISSSPDTLQKLLKTQELTAIYNRSLNANEGSEPIHDYASKVLEYWLLAMKAKNKAFAEDATDRFSRAIGNNEGQILTALWEYLNGSKDQARSIFTLIKQKELLADDLKTVFTLLSNVDRKILNSDHVLLYFLSWLKGNDCWQDDMQELPEFLKGEPLTEEEEAFFASAKQG